MIMYEKHHDVNGFVDLSGSQKHIDMSFVPAVPDHHIVPAMVPAHVKKVVTALLEYLHAIAVYGDLALAVLGPLLQHFFGIGFPDHDDVQRLMAAEIADGHLVECGIWGWHVTFD